MSTKTPNHIHGITAEWDGVELELTMTSDAISHFASELSRPEGVVFSIDSAFEGAKSNTKVVIEVTGGLARVFVAFNSVKIQGGASVLAQIARNLIGLAVLAETKGVSHMHFDHVSDNELVSCDSAGFIISVAK